MKTGFKLFLALLTVFILIFTLTLVVSAAELSGPQLTVKSFSSDHANPGKTNDYGAVLAVDDNPDTFWSNDYSPKAKPPHFIVIDLGSTVYVTGFKYLPRQDGYSGEENGNLGDYKIYVSADNVNFTEASSGTFDQFSTTESSVTFSNGVNARYFKLWTDMEWIGVAELKIITGTAPGDASASTPAAGDSSAAECSIQTNKIIYEQGEDIIASHTGSANSKYWIGICSETAPQYQGNSINVWLFANSGTQTAGKDVKESGTVTFLSSQFESKLTPGEYAMYLMKDDWHTQVAEAHFIVVEKGGDTTPPTKPDAPSSITYERTAKEKGYAAGKITVTPPKNDKGLRGFDLFWADEAGKLTSYTHIGYAPYKGGEPTVYEIPVNVIYPKNAKRIIAYSKSWGSLVSDDYAYINLNSADILPDSKMLYSFQVMTDIHTTTNSSHIYNRHFDEALKDIIGTDPESAGIFTVGDNTDHGFEEEWKLFKSTIDANLKDTKLPIYVTLGNHDLIGSKNYDDAIKLYKQYTGAPGAYYSVEVNNNTFIVLASQTLDTSNAHIKEDQFSWLKATLKTASKKGGPIFVFLHQPLKETVSGTLASIDPTIQNCAGVVQDAELRSILDQYPDVTLFTGHSHWQLDSYQPVLLSNGNTANYINSASVGYLWTDKNTGLEGSQGYYVEVYEDYVLVRGRDFVKKEWVSNAQFMLSIKSTLPASAATTLSDVRGTEYELATSNAVNLGIISGFPDGTYKPDNNINRAGVAKIVVAMLGYSDQADALKGLVQFKDVKPAYWGTGFINVAAKYKLVVGNNGNFMPEDNISYQECITIFLRALGYGPSVDSSGKWPANYLAKAKELNILSGIKSFSPASPASRGDVAKLAWNVLNTKYFQSDTILLKVKFPDYSPISELRD